MPALSLSDSAYTIGAQLVRKCPVPNVPGILVQHLNDEVPAPFAGTPRPALTWAADLDGIEPREALQRSNDRLEEVLDSITDGFVVVDSAWRLTYVNRRAEEVIRPLRKTRESILGRSLWTEFPALVGTEFELAYRRARRLGESVEVEARYPPLAAWILARANPSADGLCIYFQDVTRRKQAEMRLAAERSILELIAADAPLHSVLEAVARESEQQSWDGMLCSILLLDAAGRHLRHGAAPSLPDEYIAAIDGIAIGPGVGSCGTAAYERRAVWVSDIASDPLWVDFRQLAQQHGLGACCSAPVMTVDGTVLATIAMYYRRPWTPSASDAEIIALASRLVGIAIERQRASEALRRSEERLRATFEQAGVGIASADANGRFVELNPKFCEILGYSAAELGQINLRELTHPQDRQLTDDAIAALRAGTTSQYVIEKRYLRKDGSPVWCNVTATLSHDREGNERFIRLVEDITERRATEEALRRSEQFSRGVLESTRDCIKTLSLDGTLTWISDSAKRALCIDNEAQVLGRCWIDFWEGDDREKARSAVAAAASGGNGAFVGRYRVNGADRWWDVAITPMRDADDRPDSLLAISRDITERFEADAKIKQSAKEMLELANLIPQLAWMAQPDGHIFWYNEGWYRYTGTTPEAMEGWGWQSVHDPAILPEVLSQWQRSLATGEPFEMEFPLRGADGAFRWFLTRVNPMRDASGRVTRWFGTNTNVDNVKRIQQALQEETRVLELLNTTGMALASKLDLKMLLQTITDAGTDLSGARFGAFFYNTVDERGEAFTLYTLSGASVEAFARFGEPRATALFGPTFRGEDIIRCADVLQDPRYGRSAPHHGLPAGHPPVRSYLAVPVIAKSGEVLGGLFFGHPDAGVFTQRTERLVAGLAAQAAVAVDNARLYAAAQKSSEERKLLLDSERHARAAAEHAARTKDEFLATLSHELRTPLSAILGWTQVLRLKPAAPDEVRKGLEAIERNARVQKQLIEDLLDMSRIASGKLRLDLQPIDPVSFVEAAVDTVRPAAAAKGVALDVELECDAAVVSGDPSRLQQVVWNLLSNAIKFTPSGGGVSVTVQVAEACAVIAVRDSGQGIEPEFLPHVFERFRQADASSTRQHGGLGLGLAIVKHLVQLHNGRVRAESDGDGRGARFVVELPLADAMSARYGGATVGAHPRSDFRVADLSGCKVLVVDDQEDARDLVKRVLTECKAEVIAVADAQEALAALARERPDVIVSDIGMPDVDGIQLLGRIRGLGAAQGGDVPALALTAFARPEDQSRVLAAGFAVHLSKPLEPSELVAKIAQLVRGRPRPPP
jgi:PAS domain S-box-containing protein